MAFLLVAGVIFILAQTMGIVGTRSMDTSQQLDSTAALMLAESGLQRAEAMVGRVGNSGTMAEGDCTGIATGGPFSLGRGSFSYSTPVAEPSGCAAGLCNTCSVGVTGTVGSASRTLSQKYILGVSNGVAGRGTTVTMVLRNIHDVPATSLFNMAWKRQDPGGNADATYCADGAPGCGLQWNLESNGGGQRSVGGMGVTVDIPANTISKLVVQTISQSRDYVEVGGLFPSLLTTAPPTIVGSFWNDKGGATSPLTGVNSGSVGGVINGVAPTTGACQASPTTYPTSPPGSFQLATCTQWCMASDTLVYGASGRSDSSSDQLTPAVTFGISGSTPQNVTMTRLVHFPNLDGTTPNASGKAFSEIWYKYNKTYTSADTGTGAGLTSYASAVKATSGGLMTLNSSIKNGDTTVTVASISGHPVCPNDKLVKPGDTDGSTIDATPAGAACSSAGGIYTISSWGGGPVNANVKPEVWGRTLFVTGRTGADMTAGEATLRTSPTTASTITISSGPSGGNYSLSPPAYIGSLSYITQGPNSNTIKVPSGSALPSIGTRVALYAASSSPVGTGTFAAATKVLSVGSDSFTLSDLSDSPVVPSVGLYGASICGGICAFFNDPSNPTAITEFRVDRTSGTTQFASGFVCLRGVDKDKIAPVLSTTLTTSRWQEVVN
jgi:Tfp pilus assembly protein PilX